MIGSISSQFSGENSFNEVGKTAQNSLKHLVENNAQTPKFIGLEKLAVGVCQTCRSTGRRSYFRPLCHRSIGRSTEARIQRASLSVQSTARSTGAFPESRALWTVDRPSCQTGVHRRARLVLAGGRSTDPVDRPRALLSGKAPVDRTVDRTERLALCILASVDGRPMAQRSEI